ncbi:phosphonate metabolism protein PhnI, partial [Acidithiobacillus sp. GGI-221]
MSYVAVKGGSTAIRAAHRLVRKRMRGDPDAPEITPRQICEQMHLGVDRVMAEASLYDEDLAARAMLQAQGDMIEAIFLLRAYRATLTRFLDSTPLAMDTMRVQRRISAAFKELPGGQQLGQTYDYSHRLFGYFDRLETKSDIESGKTEVPPEPMTSVMDLLEKEGLMELAAACEPPAENMQQDITRHPLLFPATRAQRLQSLA